MLPPPCVDVAGNTQTVCVAQPLIPAVTTPGINLRALGAAPADVARLGVEIEISQSDLLLPPEDASSLKKACAEVACGVAKPIECQADGLTCSFSALIVPAGSAAKNYMLQAVNLKAVSRPALERAESEIWYFTTINGHWAYWSLARIISGEPPTGLPRMDTQ